MMISKLWKTPTDHVILKEMIKKLNLESNLILTFIIF